MRRIVMFFSLLVLVAGLAACGDNATAGADEEPDAETEQPADADDSDGDTTTTSGVDPVDGPITVVDGTGAEVTLDAAATRVVSLEWSITEDLLLLGVEPVGAADADGYSDWVADPAMPVAVENVGTRQEPSVERIHALEPDLIIGVDFRHAAVRDQLEAVAPTILFSPYGDEGSSQLAGMRSTFVTIGEAVGRTDEAAEVLDELDSHLADSAQTLADAGLDGQEIAVAQGFTSQGTPTVRVFSTNAMVIELLDEIGLPNGWPGEPSQYGFDTVDLEGLTQLGEVELFTIAQDDDDIFTAWVGNPIWEGLPFVQSDSVHPLAAETWTFGGPASARVFTDQIVALLTA